MASQADVKKAMAQAAQTSVVQAQKIVEDSAAQARSAVEQGFEQISKGAEGVLKATEEAVEFGRGNMDAVTKASQVYIAGVQDISRQAMAMVQSLSDQALDNVKALSAARSLKEAADLQASFARAGFERVMGETAKLQEQSLKLAEQAAAPLTARMTLAMEKLAKPLAA
jgi:phasin family protein